MLTLHNLTYMEALVAGARGAIESSRYPNYTDAVLAGSTPWDAGVPVT